MTQIGADKTNYLEKLDAIITPLKDAYLDRICPYTNTDNEHEEIDIRN